MRLNKLAFQSARTQDFVHKQNKINSLPAVVHEIETSIYCSFEKSTRLSKAN